MKSGRLERMYAESAKQWQSRAEAAFVRAENAERERDEARELRDSARALNSKLMENLEFHKRSGREQDVAIGEFRRQLAAAVAANCCKSCEGPLTCAKCVPVVPESRRIVELQGMLTERELYSRQNHDLIATLTQVNNELRETIQGIDDHEARIKALTDSVNAMCRRLASVEFNAPAKVHCGTCGKDREVECTNCSEERRG